MGAVGDRRGAILATALALAGVAGAPSSARADDPRALKEASALFDGGVQARKRGDQHEAALMFARADELVPDPAALEAALRAAVLADEAVLGMKLVARAEGRGPLEGAIADAVQEARTKLGGRVGTISVVGCHECRVWVDGTLVTTEGPQWVTTGAHDVVFEVDGGASTARVSVRVEAGRNVDVTPAASPAAPPAAPAAPPAPIAPASTGLSPFWFWAGLGATTVTGSITVGLAVRTRALHQSFLHEERPELADDGRTFQNATNVMALVTAALVLTTAGIGIFAVRWTQQPPPVSGAISLGTGRATVLLGKSF